MEVDDHQVQMIADDPQLEEDDLQAPGDGLLGLMAEDSHQVLRGLMGDLLGRVGGLQAPGGGLLVDS